MSGPTLYSTYEEANTTLSPKFQLSYSLSIWRQMASFCYFLSVTVNHLISVASSSIGLRISCQAIMFFSSIAFYRQLRTLTIQFFARTGTLVMTVWFGVNRTELFFV